MQHFALTLLFVEGSFEHGKQEGAIGLFASQFGDDVAQCELGNGFCGDMARKIVPDGGVVFEDDNHTLANMVELFFFAESRDGLLYRGQCLGVFKPVLPEMTDGFFHAVEHALAERNAMAEPTPRDTLLDHAYEIADKYGLAALSVRGLASDCNVSVGTIYNHFASKGELTTATRQCSNDGSWPWSARCREEQQQLPKPHGRA